MRQDLSQANNSPPPAGDHEPVNRQPGEAQFQGHKRYGAATFLGENRSVLKTELSQMNTSPQKNIEVGPRTFRWMQFCIGPDLGTGG
jgi:hypothetical protein